MVVDIPKMLNISTCFKILIYTIYIVNSLEYIYLHIFLYTIDCSTVTVGRSMYIHISI